jgi:putative hydrolase of the HAD superfamily
LHNTASRSARRRAAPRRAAPPRGAATPQSGKRGGTIVWLFDLDNTLHDASHAAFGPLNQAMTDYIVRELALAPDDADRLRRHYWRRYGATLLGLIRHHGVSAAHFLHHTHLMPGLEDRVHGHPHDFAALRALPGRKFILTNAPLAYTERVLGVLGIARWFDGVIPIERMRMFGHLRPKPDARMLRHVAARLGVPPTRCVLVEDTLQHQKAARGIGMGTVWMQRWARRGAGASAARLARRPAYVDRRVGSLRELAR